MSGGKEKPLDKKKNVCYNKSYENESEEHPMPNVIVFDTETTSCEEKCFCYNVGWLVLNTESGEILSKHDKVVEQIWHNQPLFATAYYAEKRPLYVSAMRGKRAELDKWGYIMRDVAKDIRQFDVVAAFAYNSPFDDRVFDFNCEWFHTNNPLEAIPVRDIRGMVSEFITNTADYKAFCEENEMFTESGNYSGTAEAVYRYITNNAEFVEAHTALADSEIEAEILLECLKRGAEIDGDYKVSRFIARNVNKPLKIVVDGKTIHEGVYAKKWSKEGYYRFTTLEGMKE